MNGIKKLTYLGIIAGISHIFLFGGTTTINQTFAQNNPTAEERFSQKLDNNARTLDTIGKWFYILIMPLLVVAGFAMDNSMVYGSIFGFDAALRNIRNLTKNIANFLLGFLFLFFLFTSLADIKIGNKSFKPKEIVINTLIAGILIQASRFIVAAAVDISTIATYGVGGLPLSVLGKVDNNKKKVWSETNPYLLGTEIYVDMRNEKNPKLIKITPSASISPCEVRSFQIQGGTGNESLIIGRSLIYYEKKSGRTGTMPGVCHHYGNIYRYKEGAYAQAEGSGASAQSQHENILNIHRNNIFSGGNTGDATQAIKDGYVLQIAPLSTKIFSDGTEIIVPTGKIVLGQGEVGLDENMFKLAGGTENTNGLSTLSDLLEKSKSYVGVFGTMYGNLLNLGSGEFGLGNEPSSGFLRALTNALYCAALLIPLIALVVVLVFRIGILRIVIALAPIIIIMKVFKFDDKLGKDSHFTVENIIQLLLAPVLIGFAVSLCTVFLEIIIGITQSNIHTESTDILGIIDLNIRGGTVNIAKFITIIAGIALSRFLLFWAIETNSVGKKYIQSFRKGVEKMAMKSLGNIPIIPTFNGETVGVNAIGGAFNTVTSSINEELISKNNKQLEQLLEGTAMEKAIMSKDNINQRNQQAASALTNNDLDRYYQQLSESNYQDTKYKTTYTNSNNKTYSLSLEDKDITDNQKNLIYLLGRNNGQTTQEKEYNDILMKKAVSNIEKITLKEDLETLISLIQKSSKKDEYLKNIPENQTRKLYEKGDTDKKNGKTYYLNKEGKLEEQKETVENQDTNEEKNQKS